ncbi:acyl carrier protein [Streptomyces poriferorum]|uniref:Acyl carrier protein n=1 Tax=Streptomyces poriferorum TaxID=2798799 RepID=A0ABY9IWX1_9ACTN|nr:MULTISPECIES: acyl carrier protein [Streptomyces]WSQ45649.1 acyl carrier protein [Streptomyces sp. NBC_01220]MBW5248174.1 acyl carrier protein [Streptomyces poriferorum]MBW5255794.1 acyl carrier protein [Streptomyces poriferorum]MDP5312767.1 acyl carrier protein [Streptomyces sp. Alt4]TXS37366.1 acyl carrier protein [Streptomyces sp. or43]
MTVQTVELDAELRTRVIDIVNEELELEDGELTEDGLFIEDYDSDSLTLITVVSRIEKELGFVLPKEELESLTTLRTLLLAVEGCARNA